MTGSGAGERTGASNAASGGISATKASLAAAPENRCDPFHARIVIQDTVTARTKWAASRSSPGGAPTTGSGAIRTPARLIKCNVIRSSCRTVMPLCPPVSWPKTTNPTTASAADAIARMSQCRCLRTRRLPVPTATPRTPSAKVLKIAGGAPVFLRKRSTKPSAAASVRRKSRRSFRCKCDLVKGAPSCAGPNDATSCAIIRSPSAAQSYPALC
jgi:hypothetical protein